MHNNHYIELEKIFTKITQLQNILTIAQWDFSTYLPAEASEDKGKEIATLSSFISSLEKSEETASLIRKSALKNDESQFTCFYHYILEYQASRHYPA